MKVEVFSLCHKRESIYEMQGQHRRLHLKIKEFIPEEEVHQWKGLLHKYIEAFHTCTLE